MLATKGELIFQKYWTANKKKGKRNALFLKEEIFKNNKVMVTCRVAHEIVLLCQKSESFNFKLIFPF